MDQKDKHQQDIIDEDLYEEIDDEALFDLVEEQRQKVLVRKKKQRSNWNQNVHFQSGRFG
ncbi:hypothetical protein [Virgibacillus salarius]|uniref:hypothetical protein n=1 Tax=Virgibacillus salarius TaxID=447199 RepID=UPI0031E6562B